MLLDDMARKLGLPEFITRKSRRSNAHQIHAIKAAGYLRMGNVLSVLLKLSKDQHPVVSLVAMRSCCVYDIF